MTLFLNYSYLYVKILPHMSIILFTLVNVKKKSNMLNKIWRKKNKTKEL